MSRLFPGALWRAGLALVLVALVPPAVPAAEVAEGFEGPSAEVGDRGGEDDWSEEEEDDDEGGGRSFVYKELVGSGLYSLEGVLGIPSDDESKDHFEVSPRPPGNYVGVDYVRTFGSSSFLRTLLPRWLPLTAIDLHPRLVYDAMEEGDFLDRIEFAPQDFWVRFNPAKKDRLALRIGQFVIPYGVNPILAPRQRFILPLEASDLGLKWDWGLDVKGPVGEYDWQVAATLGSGEALHSTIGESYLVSGRIGAPTYWDFQYGMSFVYGDLPGIRGARLMRRGSISRWRLGLDGLYKYGTYLMAGAQLTGGQDGFAGDEELNAGSTADVLGYRFWADWVIPAYQDIRLDAQFESVIRDLSTSGSDDTALIFGGHYSLTTSISLMLHYRKEFNRSMGAENDAIYLTFVYYAR